MDKFEIANVLKKELIYFLNKNIGFNTSRYDINNITDYETSSFNEMEFVTNCENNCNRLNWDFGFGYNNSSIWNLVPYPWGIDLGMVISGAVRGNISDSDFYRYFELCHETENIITEAVSTKMELACGSEKFNLATVDFFNTFMKYVKESIRGIEIEDHFITYATYRNQVHKCTMSFSKELSYAQKRKMRTYLQYKLVAFYKKLNPEINHLMNINMNYNFEDGGRKAAPCDTMTVTVKANDWKAIGLDPSAAFVPRMGMKRATTL
jgi:hypothetical protein